MEYYVRKEGRTLGPLLPFQLREMLEEETVELTDLGWHDGMEQWAPLREIEALETLLPPLETADAVPPPPPGMPPLPAATAAADETATGHAAQLQEVRQRSLLAWRRFFARTLDLALFGACALGAAVAAGWLNPVEFTQPQLWVALGTGFLWMPLEALLVWRFGATLGKMLLGLRIHDTEGRQITLRQAFRRSMDVWLFGCGCEIPIINIVSKIFSFNRLRMLDTTSWDQRNATGVAAGPLPAAGVVSAVLLFLALVVLRMWMLLNFPPPDLESLLEPLRRHSLPAPGEASNSTEPAAKSAPAAPDNPAAAPR
ncbi:MAG: RDD family protein [Verrucomicrobiales bacterium]|nr:RDD family protein [Verrucomicrobiales bacterium]